MLYAQIFGIKTVLYQNNFFHESLTIIPFDLPIQHTEVDQNIQVESEPYKTLSKESCPKSRWRNTRNVFPDRSS